MVEVGATVAATVDVVGSVVGADVPVSGAEHAERASTIAIPVGARWVILMYRRRSSTALGSRTRNGEQYHLVDRRSQEGTQRYVECEFAAKIGREPNTGFLRVPTMGLTAVTDRPSTNAAPLQRSFEDFYRSSRDSIARALVMTLGNQELGVEATDEAMTRAYQRWDKIRDYENIEGWVYRVGLNWARSIWRKRRREVGEIFNDAGGDDRIADIDLEKAVAGLDVRFRAVVVLRLYLDWSVAATAAALEIKPGTVKSRMSRALARLEQELGGDR